MNLKKYLVTMSIITIILWVLFIFITNIIDPEITNWIGFLLFYISLFFALSGAATVFGLLIRSRFKFLKRRMTFYYVKIAFRQSFLFAFLIISVLFLSSKNLLTWFNLFLLIIIISILEFFLSNYKQHRIQSYGK